MSTSTLKGAIFVLAVSLSFLGCRQGADERTGQPQKEMFTRMSAEKTNVDFENTLSEQPTPHRTELLYEYFANGGGVAVGDLDGNGRDDIYFVGNMKYNKLYLNEGDMEFKDVTEIANVQGRKNTWNTGVSMADVNGDGRLDIYVCFSGDLPLERRVDALYVNQGTDEEGRPQFEEQAEQYGLAQPHSSNQAYFFDYDRDGDLDLYLQTHNVETIPRESQRRTQKKIAQVDSVNGNRFYENRGGTFADVTGAVGIQSSPVTYGLGAGVSDVNKDGWPDIYVGNDYSPPDHLYINNGDGTFTDELASSMGHTSRASMGIDVADVNNDLSSDIFVLDMLSRENKRQKLLHMPNDRKLFRDNVERGFYYQYTINTLQMNHGNGTFSEVGQLSGVSNTDWSWASLIADYDNDGWKDIFVTNGLLHDITNRDFIEFRRKYIMDKNYDLKPKDISVLMENLPSSDLENYAFKNKNGAEFGEVSTEWNLDDAVNSNGAAYSDLDDDGDLDLVTNNINSKSYIYRNSTNEASKNSFLKVKLEGDGQNAYGVGSKVYVYADSTSQYVEQFPARGYLSSVSPTLHFGLGAHPRADSVRVVWPDGRRQTVYDVPANQTLTLRQGDAVETDRAPASSSPIFREVSSPVEAQHQMAGDIDDFRRQPLMVNPKSFSGPAMAQSDVNGDGRTDLFVGGGNGQASTLYLQEPDGTFTPRSSSVFEADQKSNDIEALFADVNDDGHPDLYVASGGYGRFREDDPALQDRLYLNDGTGTFSKKEEALPQMRTSTGAVAAADVNGDGAPDLFVGGRVVPGRYPESPRSYVLINDGTGQFADRTSRVAPELQRTGMVTDAEWHDLDENGRRDLVVVGEWMPIRVFENEGGTLSDETTAYFERPRRGLWNIIRMADLNGDGRQDLIAGNLGHNSQLTASDDEPAELFYDDFDRNGSVDPLLSYYIDGTRRPHPLLDRLREQMPRIGARFSTYRAYAEATMADVLTEQERREAGRLRVNLLATSLFARDEEGTFERATLPVEAQFAPVFSIEVMDYDEDGERDVLLTGNINETRIRFGKYDANYGTLLRGEGDGSFEYVPQRRSGFKLRGDVRGTVRVGDTLIFGINRDETRAYRRAGQ
jgi:hypothetical protein